MIEFMWWMFMFSLLVSSIVAVILSIEYVVSQRDSSKGFLSVFWYCFKCGLVATLICVLCVPAAYLVKTHFPPPSINQVTK